MNPLRESIQDYLALRRSLGFKLREAGICLAKFAAFLEARGATHLTTQLALEWAQQSPSTQPATWAQRLGYVRGFARYHAASDPQSEIPPPGLLPFHPRRARPYLYSEEEIAHLLRCALELPPAGGLRPLTYHCLLGLLSAAAAQEQPDESSATAESAEAKTEPVTESAEPPAPTSERSPDTFTPSEEISEDLSVSFPVDI